MEKRFQVFVSSTFLDLQEERQRVWQTLIDFGYIVSGMEHFPAADEDQLSYIRRQIDNSDFYVLILGGRYGALSETGLSFTEREFYAVEAGVPTLVFPIRDPKKLRVEQTDQDTDKAEKLNAFRGRACTRRLVKQWSDSTELCLNIAQALSTAIAAGNRPGWMRGNTLPSEQLLQEHVKLQSDYNKLKTQLEANRSFLEGFDSTKLGSWTEIDFDTKSDGETHTVRVSARDILSQLSLLEDFDETTLDHAVRGAITMRHKTHKDFDDIAIREWQLDRVVAMLLKLEIVDLKETLVGLTLVRGRHFVSANVQCKSFGYIPESQPAQAGRV
jgi:hypothetical protein